MDLSGISVLVTGGAGFIGARLCTALVAQGATVTAYDNLLQQVHGDNRDNIDRLAASGARLIEGDVADSKALRDALVTTRPQLVYHLAAETGTGQSFNEPAHYTMVNVQGTSYLIEAIRAVGGVRRVVLAASRSVYGEGACVDADGVARAAVARSAEALGRGDYAPRDADGRALTPVPTAAARCPVAPASVYASSKLMQEYLLQQAFWGLDVEVGLLRLQNVYGPGQSLSNPYTGVLSIFVRQILDGLILNIYEDGQITRDFVFVDDVVTAFMKMGQATAVPKGPVDIGLGQGTSILDVARLMLQALGAPPDQLRITGHFRAGDIRYGVADITAARDVLGWQPEVHLAEGLDHLLQWSQEGGQTTAPNEATT